MKPQMRRAGSPDILRKPRLRVVRQADARAVPARWTETVIDTPHGSIAVRQTPGRSLPVLLIHGNSSCKEVFRRQMDGHLGARYRMIAIDLPGHGASGNAPDPGRSYTIPGYADAAVAVLEALDIEHAVVFGWSLGGHVALDMVTRFPGIRGVMICGTPPVASTLPAILAGFTAHPHLGLTGKAAWTDEDLSNFRDLVFGDHADPMFDRALRRTDPRSRARMFEHLAGGFVDDQRALVETSGVPLAVVNGAEDPIVDVGYLTGLAYAKLWGRRCHLIPGTHHAPFLEQPAVFNQIFARFLRRMEQRHRAQLDHASLCFSG